MNRTVTLTGFVVLAVAMALRDLAAKRARNQHRVPRPLSFVELVIAAARQSRVRWPLLVGWLWLGWHVFARANWR